MYTSFHIPLDFSHKTKKFLLLFVLFFSSPLRIASRDLCLFSHHSSEQAKRSRRYAREKSFLFYLNSAALVCELFFAFLSTKLHIYSTFWIRELESVSDCLAFRWKRRSRELSRFFSRRNFQVVAILGIEVWSYCEKFENLELLS